MRRLRSNSLRLRAIFALWIGMVRMCFRFQLFSFPSIDGHVGSGWFIEADAWLMATAATSSTVSSSGSSTCLSALASSDLTSRTSRSVLVTGASGRTGQLVFSALLDDPRFEPKALVRSKKSAKKLMRQVPKTRLDQIIISDVTTLLKKTDEGDSKTTIPPGLNGVDSMVVCTSAVPTISKISLLKALFQAPFNLIRGKKAFDFRKLKFVWKYGCYPEIVDYHGQISQFELAKQLEMKEIVLVGSMGGTDPSNFLNSVGKNADGTGNGDILLWKRKAEKYLIESGLDYVIIHPGGLIDTQPGQEDYVLDVNDKLVNNKKRSISRADVANLCVAALALENAVNCPSPATTTTTSSNINYNKRQQPRTKQIAFDCVTQMPEEGKPVRTAEQALQEFLQQSKTYDYSL
jgi:NAD(P)H-binding